MKFSSILALSALTAGSAFTFIPSSRALSKTQLDASLGGKSPGVVSKTAEWDMAKISPIVRIEGETRHTWNLPDNKRELVQVALKSSGRPVNADVQLWIGPDWTPVKVNIHSEDGKEFPVQTLIGTRNKAANLEVKNTGPYTMPLDSAVSYAISPLADAREDIAKETEGRYIEGGSKYIKSFDPTVDQLHCLLKTNGMQLNAKLELLQGPNNVKLEFEVFTNNGLLNSLFVVFDTPGEGYAIRVKNLAPMEYPCECFTKASKIGTKVSEPYSW